MTALLCVAQFALAAHMVFGRHAVCAEHGLMVHGGHAVPGAGVAATATPTDKRGAPAAGVGAAHGDEHEHCDALAMQQVAPDVRCASEPVVLDGFLLPLPPDVPFALPGRSLLGLAPKTSPPV
ncbi:MAG: hypothetical protein IT373_28940 [Polyangiaceae bacterium]|nr:hypothetical protein [Polyangiaceae bacterium]